MAKPSFKYRERTAEDVQRRAKQSSGRYDSYLTEEVTWFKPRADENCIRLIPWLDQGAKDFDKYDKQWGNHWGIDIIVHRNVGPDNGTYLCLDKMKGEPCPICDAWRGDDIEALKPSDRVLCWLIDRNDEKAGPQVWAMPLGVSKDISAVSQEKGSKALLLIDNWEEGYDVFFDREGEKKRTQYKRISIDRNSSPLQDNQDRQDDWLEYVFDLRLPDILKYYESDYLEKVLSGQRREDGDGGDRDDVRGSRRRDTGDDNRGDREETTSRGRSRDDSNADHPTRGRRGDNAQDADDRPRGRRPAADSDDGGREERTTRRGREETEPSRRRGNGEGDPPWRDKEAEGAQEAKEARASRRPVDDDTSKARGKLERVGRGK